jgi:serine/threonine protein kinase/Tfp pilus assembly protein PilF
MNDCAFPPTHQLPAPDVNHADLGTVRNWSEDLGAIPADVDLEPAALIDNLRASDPVSADRLRDALERFPPVGGRFAGFDLVAVLGRGTFGRVYLARQGELADRFVALKVSTDLSGESQILARLQHTNIVPIYSAHRVTPFHAVCMPFFGVTTLAHLLHRFRGGSSVPATGRQLIDTLRVLSAETDLPSLGSRTGGTGPQSHGPAANPAEEVAASVARGPLVRPGGALDALRTGTYPDAVCWIGARLADGLEHAHAHGILHNDLKPANVLLTDDGQPMLLDFGVSEDLKVRAVAPRASVGGTLPYMAPEHLRSLRDRAPATDARSDVYALGVLLFELLTAERPFREPTGELDEEVPRMLAERGGPPPRLRPLNAGVSPGLEAIVRKCLAPDPAARYQCAADLREDLERHRADQPLRHVRVPLRERLRKWAKRHPRLSSHASLGSATALALGACLAGLFALSARAERAEAAETARRSSDEIRVAHFLLGSRPPESATVDEGIATCRTALARYGLPNDGDWDRRPAFRALSEEERQKTRARLTDACILLARALAVRSGADPQEPLGDAVRANEWAERIAGADAPRAVWEQRAELMRRLGRSAAAARAAERAKEAPLATARDYHLSGTEALADGRHQEALKLLRRAVELDPSEFATHMSLGLCHEGLGQYPDAAACYTTAVALRPDHAGAYHARGLVRLRLPDPARAKADFDRAAELQPEAPDLYLDRALAHQGLRDYAAALRDVEAALDLGASRVRGLCLRSRYKDLTGDQAGSKADLADALSEKAPDDVSLVARGLARLNTDLPGALADFTSALELNPRSLPALQNRAHVLSRQGKNRDALKSLDALLELYPDFVPARAGRAVLSARLGNEKDAVADAEGALKRDPGAATAYQVAGAYALLDKVRPGARAEALRLLAAALRNGYGHEYVELDKDLDPIRDAPEFKRIVESVKSLRPDAGRR